MPKAKTNYTKTAVLQMFRKLVDSGKPWLELQADVLPGVECVGGLYALLDGAPANAPRHARPGTALDKAGLRHALRDIHKAVRMADEVSNERMDEAFRDREETQAAYDEFFNEKTRWGKYYDLRRDIERLSSAELRVRKIAVLDDQRHRLAAIRDSAVKRFSLIEDERFFYNKTCLKYADAFPEYRQWVPPDAPDPLDTRNPQTVAIDSLDFDAMGFDDSELFYVEHLSGKMLGSVKGGPMFFVSQEAGRQHTEDSPKLSLARDTLTADRVRETCRWFAERHRFTSEEPKHAKFLYQEFPALLDTSPPDDREFTEELAAVQPRTGW